MRTRFFRNESGMALMFVALMFAAAAVIAAGLLERSRQEIKRTAWFIDTLQAKEYALGAEAYAQSLFNEQQQKVPTTKKDDTNAPPSWKQASPFFPVPDGGGIDMSIEDLGARFNINSLQSGRQAAKDNFLSLMESAGLDEAKTNQIIAKVMDANSVKDAKTGNVIFTVFMADASELIDYGLPPAVYRVLAPYLMALPTTKLTKPADGTTATAPTATTTTATTTLTATPLSGAQPNIGDAFLVTISVHYHQQTVTLSSTLFNNSISGGSDKFITVTRRWQ